CLGTQSKARAELERAAFFPTDAPCPTSNRDPCQGCRRARDLMLPPDACFLDGPPSASPRACWRADAPLLSEFSMHGPISSGSAGESLLPCRSYGNVNERWRLALCGGGAPHEPEGSRRN